MKEKTNNKKEKYKIITIKFLVILSFLINIILIISFFSEKAHFHLNYEDYPFLSKRIFNQSPNDVILNFVPLRKAMKEYVNNQNGNVGIYFEYLPSGISIGVNDREEVKIASLTKVPLAMSIMKKIEKGKLSLDTKVVIKEENLDSKFGNLYKKGAGSIFSVKELIDESLINSDNTAYDALFNLLTTEEVVEVYENLEIEVNSRETKPIVSPKSFSSIFRSLYLASYLSEEDSNYILDILSRTSFNDKIPAGIPNKNIKIAHKIGVFSRIDNPDKLFSDCGIIYVPDRPYTVCAFVQGSDEEAKKHISYLSYMIYSYVTLIKSN